MISSNNQEPGGGVPKGPSGQNSVKRNNNFVNDNKKRFGGSKVGEESSITDAEEANLVDRRTGNMHQAAAGNITNIINNNNINNFIIGDPSKVNPAALMGGSKTNNNFIDLQ